MVSTDHNLLKGADKGMKPFSVIALYPIIVVCVSLLVCYIRHCGNMGGLIWKAIKKGEITYSHSAESCSVLWDDYRIELCRTSDRGPGVERVDYQVDVSRVKDGKSRLIHSSMASIRECQIFQPWQVRAYNCAMGERFAPLTLPKKQGKSE